MTPQEAYEKRYGRSWSDTAQGVQNLWLAAWTIAWSMAEADEREACARVCEEHPDGLNMMGGAFVTCANAIRRRTRA